MKVGAFYPPATANASVAVSSENANVAIKNGPTASAATLSTNRLRADRRQRTAPYTTPTATLAAVHTARHHTCSAGVTVLPRQRDHADLDGAEPST